MKTLIFNCWHTRKVMGNYSTLLLFLTVFTTLSCQKVVNIDLNTSSPKLSIHGLYIHNLNRLFVQVSNTESYYVVGGEYKPIKTGVAINLKDGDNVLASTSPTGDIKEVKFEERSNYNEMPTERDLSKPAYQVEVALTTGKEYTLEVTYGGNTYISKSTLLGSVTVDKSEYVKNEFGNNDGAAVYDIDIYFQDDPNVKEYYLFKYSQFLLHEYHVNSPADIFTRYIRIDYKGNKDYYVSDSEIVDVGGKKVGSLFMEDFEVRVITDLNRKGPQFKYTIRASIIGGNLPPTWGHVVAVSKIDEVQYIYLKQLSTIINSTGGPGGGAISSPGNPVKNWKTSDNKDADVLGYFGCVNYSIANQQENNREIKALEIAN